MRFFIVATLALAVTLVCACKRAAPREDSSYADPLNRVETAPKTTSLNLVHNTFKVTRYTKFEFEVPAHSATPKLQGDFELSSAERVGDIGDQAEIDFLLMTQDEFEDFTQGRTGAASYSVMGTPAQTVDYALPSTLEFPQKYYVVLRNPAAKAHPESVTADLTVLF